MRSEVRWERMFPDELESAIEQCPALYLPYGLCEPHGPQSALGMDALRAHAYCCRAALEGGGIVAPASYWHIHEVGIYAAWAHNCVGDARSWLSAIPPWMFFKNLAYHVRAADAHGFHAVIVLTGHGGPHSQDMATVQKLLQPHFAARLAFVPCTDITDASVGHGGAVETSLLWAVEPECVDMSRIPQDGMPTPRFAMGQDAREADRRLGERLVDGIASKLKDTANQLLDAYEEPPEGRRPVTFAQVEQMWQNNVQPVLPDLASMQDLRPGTEPPPEDSRWRAQWHIPIL